MTIKSTGWTKEKRARMALMCKKVAPWRLSTGPRTPQGKKRVRLNAQKHGRYSARYKAAYRWLSTLLKCHNKRLKALITPPQPQKPLFFERYTPYNATL